MSAQPPAEPGPPARTTLPERSVEERKELLDAAIQRAAAKGWRVETKSDVQATIVKGHRTNHILHLILSIITLGIWLIVWVLMAAAGERDAYSSPSTSTASKNSRASNFPLRASVSGWTTSARLATGLSAKGITYERVFRFPCKGDWP